MSDKQPFPRFEDNYDGRVMRQFVLLLEQQLASSPLRRIRRTLVNSATYTVQLADELLAVTRTATGACTISLPAAANIIAQNRTKTLIIKDEGGNASSNNITLTTNGSETIDGASSLVMSTNYQAVRIYSDGNNLFTI